MYLQTTTQTYTQCPHSFFLHRTFTKDFSFIKIIPKKKKLYTVDVINPDNFHQNQLILGGDREQTLTHTLQSS